VGVYGTGRDHLGDVVIGNKPGRGCGDIQTDVDNLNPTSQPAALSQQEARFEGS
tara:strand:+ start:2483 stop:2644 length:162 start_codon:yes stop_codon:yes gene_type:complete